MRLWMRAMQSVKHFHVSVLFLADLVLLAVANIFSQIIISSVTNSSISLMRTFLSSIIPTACCAIGLLVCKVYKLYLRHISAVTFFRCFCGITIGVLMALTINILLDHNYHVLFYAFYYLLAICAVFLTRIIISLAFYRLDFVLKSKASAQRTLIIGAGYTGTQVLHEIRTSSSHNFNPIGFVDDNPKLKNLEVENISILGPTILIPELCKKLDVKVIIFAIPSCQEERKKKILSLCAQTQCDVKIVPSIWELEKKQKFLPQIKSINIEDALDRKTNIIDPDDFLNYSVGKTVLVTGVGSIGSEICRQVVKCDIEHLVMLDIYENNAYDIQQELITEGYGQLISTEIASVRDYDKCKQIFEKYKPDIVFHAAAHKHVPLMETNPEEAIKNNVLGTYNIARLCEETGAEKMILISTDKAVNPTNVMGASKRCCEMTIQYMSQQSKYTDFIAVRFGNVLGSNGSVIPLFVKQIEHGGPVTVTHPDIIRYFMTIPEAVSLVLEAGAMAKGGEIFVLDMGEPFKITTLAENIIKLYGYKPYEEMPIKFIGLRPGEKLFEEMLMNEEGLKSTKNKSIFIGNQIAIDEKLFGKQLDELIAAANQNDGANVVKILKDIVPTFKHN